MSTKNLEIVQGIYEAFGKGNIPAIIDRLHDDVEWESEARDHGVPWLKPGRGKKHAMSFFETLGGIEFHSFEPLSLLSGGDQVAAVCRLDATYRRTGRRLRDVEVHLWTFDGQGRVVRFRHFVDTLAHAEAAGL